jgi:hypothetical protein
MTTAVLVLSIIAGALVGFVLLWLAICYGIASVSGWRRLRVLYETSPFVGATSRISGYVGPSRYRGALIAGATAAGLYLNVVAVFRIGTAPLLIPWRDITVSPPSGGLVSLVTFDFPRAGTSLRVPESVAGKLLAARRGAT